MRWRFKDRLQRRISEVESRHGGEPDRIRQGDELDGLRCGPAVSAVMRMLLGVVGISVAGAAATTAVMRARPATAGNPLVIGSNNQGGATITALSSNPGPNCAGFASTNSSTNEPIGVYGVAGAVSGLAVHGGGVVGNSSLMDGVVGCSANGNGVFGQGGNFGVNGKGSVAGVIGACSGSDGYGGRFEGGNAQIFLFPAFSAGAPTGGDHSRGELFLDSHGDLYLCKTSGTPGIWKLIG
jgi:hypothetical protein